MGKLDYRVAVNNPLNPANALGAGKDFGNHSSGLTYNGSAKADENGDPVGNTIIEGYFRYNLLDAESTVLPFNVGSYLGTKKYLPWVPAFSFIPMPCTENQTRPMKMFLTLQQMHFMMHQFPAEIVSMRMQRLPILIMAKTTSVDGQVPETTFTDNWVIS